MARILLLEDEYKLLRLYTKMLNAMGHEVVSSVSALTVQEMVERYSYDLLISDVQIGLIHSDFTLRQVKRLCDQHHIPVLIISAYLEKYADTCKTLGFEYTLPKPFTKNALSAMVQSILHKEIEV